MIILDIPDIRMEAMLYNTTNSNFTFENKFRYSSNILIISMGLASYPYCTEVLVGNILADSGVQYRHSFLKSTQCILEQYYKNNILNNHFIRFFTGEYNLQSDVSIITIDIENSIENIMKNSDKIRNLYPDYIILTTDGIFNNFLLVDNYMKYGCGKSIDMIITSPVFIINEKHWVNCENKLNSCEKAMRLSDKRLPIVLRNDIFTKLTFPNEITPI